MYTHTCMHTWLLSRSPNHSSLQATPTVHYTTSSTMYTTHQPFNSPCHAKPYRTILHDAVYVLLNLIVSALAPPQPRMEKSQRQAAKKNRKLAGRASHQQQQLDTPEFAQTKQLEREPTEAPPVHEGALPAWAVPPKVTVEHIHSDPNQSERHALPVVTFDALIDTHDRWGAPITHALLQSCVRGCIPQLQSLASVTPSAVQAECWSYVMAPSPPDVIAISPTGSGKTLAFMLPAVCDAISSRGRTVATRSSPSRGVPAKAPAQPSEDARALAKQAASTAWKEALAEGLSQEEAKKRMLVVAEKTFRELQRATHKSRAQASTADTNAASSISLDECRVVEAAEEQAAVSPAVLILAPTRELCEQTGQAAHLVASHLAESKSVQLATEYIVGGVDFHSQAAALRKRRPDVRV